MRIINQKDLDSICSAQGLTYHHSALAKGYISRKMPCDSFCVESYKGRFGEGLKVYYPRWDTTNYCTVSYYCHEE